MHIMTHVGRLIIVILLLPLFIIFIGPCLILAALRNEQPMGPITLNVARYGLAGRVGGVLGGLLAWFVVWGALAWVVVNGVMPVVTTAEAVVATSPTPFPATATSAPPTATPIPSATPTVPTLTPTPILTLTITAVFQATPSPTITATPTPTPTINLTATATATPTLTRTPSPTATASPEPTPSPEPTETVAAAKETNPPLDLVETVRPTPQPPLSDADQEAVIETIRASNELLWLAITVPTPTSFQNLARLWQGDALEQAETFATDRAERYDQPDEVQFRSTIPLRISDQSAADLILARSREVWIYIGDTTEQQETLDFTYTLERDEDEAWVITGFTYSALSDSSE